MNLVEKPGNLLKEIVVYFLLISITAFLNINIIIAFVRFETALLVLAILPILMGLTYFYFINKDLIFIKRLIKASIIVFIGAFICIQYRNDLYQFYPLISNDIEVKLYLEYLLFYFITILLHIISKLLKY